MVDQETDKAKQEEGNRHHHRLIFGFISRDVGCLPRELGGGLIDGLDAAGAEGGVIVV